MGGIRLAHVVGGDGLPRVSVSNAESEGATTSGEERKILSSGKGGVEWEHASPTVSESC